ncbi:class I SAM-dependent methyltransferase [Aureisphaera sp. CAU 1614]|uniref:Class I SAM-dependent methyltransferase n=1 Tax=Halomarinibacterium sedimenti TaxID=2857106 RepID=A0A9X1FPA8_9FLAO|nr:class I SAM-dependent methyltransferase [Halomarinibacterium sedimenti]MBW2937898.1 class I SAM-dependent methyltransferase [Halomarinibacterium sedimenti]
MNEVLLRPEVQKFIKEFKGDVSQLAFKGSPWSEIPAKELMQQIESYTKCKDKLPTWYNSHNIIYPPKLHIEQTSSEITALYKASLVNGESLADITGGFGVDTYFFSEKFSKVHHFEQNKDLSEMAAYNYKQLNKNNVTFFAEDGLEGIQNTKYDVIFIDPSRRHASKGKVFFLKDCEPNLVEHQGFLLEHCETLLVKTSPMLDISVGLKELNNVSEIHIVALNNEVKELIWILSKSISEVILIKTINFSKTEREEFQFYYDSENSELYEAPLTYLYEPNAAIMKAGGFSKICDAFPVYKLAQHSHLFTSDTLIDFPGRAFKITSVIPYQKSEMKNFAKSKANVSTRNFQESVAQIKKKWNINDGGNKYLFFTTLQNGKKVALDTEKL